MNRFRLEVIIPSFNGLSLFKKHLPSVIKNSPPGTSVVIVDDGSTDGSVNFLAKEFPKVTCLKHEENLGFTKSVNLGVANSTADLIVLLNNDVEPKKNYLSSSIRHFEDDTVFAVTLNEISSSWPQVSWQGKLQYIKGADKNLPRYSAWASGGSAVFRKKIWNDLGGFDEIYSPGYWEDIDIGWRAWRAGFQIIWEPDAKVEHQHESTFNKLDDNFVSLVKERNELLFNWKNITDPKLRWEHLTYLIHHSASHPGYLKVIFSALKLFPKLKKSEKTVKTDEEVLSIVNQPVNDK